MRSGTKVFVGTSLGFAAGVAATLGLQAIYESDGFLKNALDAALMPPLTTTKILIIVTALIVFSALPIAILEWRSERVFARAERELRAARPDAAVTRYEGPEGRGLLFEGSTQRALLLEPTGGIGDARVVELPPPEPPAAPETAEPSSGTA